MRRSTTVASLVASLVAGSALASLPACRTAPSPVPVVGSAADIGTLAGDWEGDYSSPATGRSGSIAFRLVAGRDTAFGDVVMVPAGASRPLAPAVTPGGPPDATGARGATPAQVLTIRFVHIAADSVSGTLQPYEGPDCDCTLTTSFAGRVLGDRIEGTFVTRGAGADQTGRWTVRRKGE